MSTPPDRKIMELPIRAAGGQGKSVLVLTESRVYAQLDRGIFGRADTTIALQSVDSVFNGWQRYSVLLLLGLAGILSGLAGLVVERFASLGFAAGLVGIIFLLAFWFYRPSGIEIRSGTVAVGGRPASHEAAEEFTAALLAALDAGRGRTAGA